MNTRSGSRTAPASKMERFVIIVNGWKPLTIFTKRFILDVAAVLDLPLNTLDDILFTREVGLMYNFRKSYMFIFERPPSPVHFASKEESINLLSHFLNFGQVKKYSFMSFNLL